MSRINKSIETENTLGVAQGCVGGNGDGGLLLKSMEFLLGLMKNVPKLIVVTVAQFCEYTETIELSTLKGELYGM